MLKQNYLLIFVLFSKITLFLTEFSSYFELKSNSSLSNNSGIIEIFNMKNKYECLNKCSVNEFCYLILIMNGTCILYNETSNNNLKNSNGSSLYFKIL